MRPRVVVLFNVPAQAQEPSDVGVLQEARDVSEALEGAGYAVEAMVVHGGLLPQALADLAPRRRELVVFNLCEGLDGQARHEPLVAGLLDLFNLPFTGSPALTLSWALDKAVARLIASGQGVPVAQAWAFAAPVAAEALQDLPFPLVVKPMREDGSLGIDAGAFVRDPTELALRLAQIIKDHGQPALAEVYLGGREFNLAVVGSGEGARPLPLAEIRFEGYGRDEGRLVTHQAKWDQGSRDDRRTVPRCPALVGEALRSEMESFALRAYRAFECRDYARLDFRLSGEGQPHLIDVNPNPDIARKAGLARAVAASGLSYEEFIAHIVEETWRRRSP